MYTREIYDFFRYRGKTPIESDIDQIDNVKDWQAFLRYAFKKRVEIAIPSGPALDLSFNESRKSIISLSDVNNIV